MVVLGGDDWKSERRSFRGLSSSVVLHHHPAGRYHEAASADRDNLLGVAGTHWFARSLAGPQSPKQPAPGRRTTAPTKIRGIEETAHGETGGRRTVDEQPLGSGRQRDDCASGPGAVEEDLKETVAENPEERNSKWMV
jgi:hypothetical protein